ncbi:MAG: TSCPD domain-containing protein [Dialister sp.]|nr:TSCPD domain-containing protein [Dialister sp.]
MLLGNTCRDKQTSCADQLAHALIEAMKKGNQE